MEETLQNSDVAGSVIKHVFDWCVAAGGNIVSALIIFFVGRFIISIIKRLVLAFMVKRKTDPGIIGFTRSLLGITLNILLAVVIVNRLGVETSSFAALIASAGVAIGMAFSGNLQNFAGGIIILVLRPFKVGDFIEAQTVSGTVKDVQIFHTIIVTPDNKIVYVPNGSLSSGVISNYSQSDIRRLEWTYGVEYGSDIQKVEEIARQAIATDSRILDTPEPFVAVSALADSSVKVVIRVWVKNDDYWSVNFDMNKYIYDSFNKSGISFPFPQVTVHTVKG